MDQRETGRYALPKPDADYSLRGGMKQRPLGITILAVFNFVIAAYAMMLILLPLLLVLLIGSSGDTDTGVFVLALLVILVVALWVALSYRIGTGLWRMDRKAYGLTLIVSSVVLLADAVLYATGVRPPTVVTLLWDVGYLVSLGYLSLAGTRSAFK